MYCFHYEFYARVGAASRRASRSRGRRWRARDGRAVYMMARAQRIAPRRVLSVVLGAVGAATVLAQVAYLGTPGWFWAAPDATADIDAGGARPRLTVLTTAARRSFGKAGAPAAEYGELEYGELKAAYVYALAVDNKQRYCAATKCTLVVGGEAAEAKDRSARWTKIAWLRRTLSAEGGRGQRGEWILWTDLDAFFVDFRDFLPLLDGTGAEGVFAPDDGVELDGSDVDRVGAGAARGTRPYPSASSVPPRRKHPPFLGPGEERCSLVQGLCRKERKRDREGRLRM